MVYSIMQKLQPARKTSSIITSALVAGGMVLASSALDVAPAAAAVCDASTVTATGLGGSSYDPIACEGAFSGNDTGAQSTLLDDLNGNLFDSFFTDLSVDLDWQLSGKSDDGNAAFTADNGSTSGNWSLSTPIDGPFAISFKASNSYSVYLFDDVNELITGGTFTTDGVSTNPQGKAQDLSHASLWVPTNYPPETIPEPSTLGALGLLAAAGMFGAGKKRKQM